MEEENKKKKFILVYATGAEIYGAEKIREQEFFRPRERVIQLFKKPEDNVCVVADLRYSGAPEYKWFSDLYIAKCDEAERIFKKLTDIAKKEEKLGKRIYWSEPF